MTYPELIEAVKKLGFREKRTDLSEYLEFVIQRDRVNELSPILERFFGPPIKPAGEPPSNKTQKHTAAYGGVRTDQTLYLVEDDTVSNCAILWPWNDGQLVTVKIAQDQKSAFRA